MACPLSTCSVYPPWGSLSSARRSGLESAGRGSLRLSKLSDGFRRSLEAKLASICSKTLGAMTYDIQHTLKIAGQSRIIAESGANYSGLTFCVYVGIVILPGGTPYVYRILTCVIT